MEFLTSTLLSGAVYDVFKHNISITVENVKAFLKKWAIDELIAPAITEELLKLNLNDEMSEKSIEREIMSSEKLMQIIKQINISSQHHSIQQFHSGSGDNVAGNKIVN